MMYETRAFLYLLAECSHLVLAELFALVQLLDPLV